MKVLLIEDDRETVEYIATRLEQFSHVCDVAHDGKTGLKQALAYCYDVLIIDRILPLLDGLKLVKLLRNSGDNTPVIFVTALDGIDHKVEGLEAGGDDYLIKPFAYAELSARLHALARRSPVISGTAILQVSDLQMDLISRRVTRADRVLNLNVMEFKLLEVLLRDAGKVLTKSMLLGFVWNIHFNPHTKVVETLVCRLRAKVDKPFPKQLIKTVRGVGYSVGE